MWSCFVSRLLFLLYYVICAPVLTEGTIIGFTRATQIFNCTSLKFDLDFGIQIFEQLGT